MSRISSCTWSLSSASTGGQWHEAVESEAETMVREALRKRKPADNDTSDAVDKLIADGKGFSPSEFGSRAPTCSKKRRRRGERESQALE